MLTAAEMDINIPALLASRHSGAQLAQTQHPVNSMSKQQHQQNQLCGHTAASTLAALCPYNSSITGSSVPILQLEQLYICAQNSINNCRPVPNITASTMAHHCQIQLHHQWQFCAQYNIINSGKTEPKRQHQQWQNCAQTEASTVANVCPIKQLALCQGTYMCQSCLKAQLGIPMATVTPTVTVTVTTSTHPQQ